MKISTHLPGIKSNNTWGCEGTGNTRLGPNTNGHGAGKIL